MSDLNIPEAAYTAGEAAILGYLNRRFDISDVARDAINAATPIIINAKLNEILTKLDELRRWAREQDKWSIPRAAGVGAAIGVVLDEIDRLATEATQTAETGAAR